MKSFLYMAIAVAVILGGIIFFTRGSGGDKTADTTYGAAVSEQDWVSGSPEARLRLVEYSDFQCPACSSYFPILSDLKARLGADFALAYRHFPLAQHRHAELAARAAEAAGLQGKFFEMHDLLFTHQEAWAKEANPRMVFISYADSLGLDTTRFDADMDRADVKEKIDKQRESGLALRVNGTPTFFLNGERLPNPRSPEEFLAVLTDELARQAAAMQDKVDAAGGGQTAPE